MKTELNGLTNTMANITINPKPAFENQLEYIRSVVAEHGATSRNSQTIMRDYACLTLRKFFMIPTEYPYEANPKGVPVQVDGYIHLHDPDDDLWEYKPAEPHVAILLAGSNIIARGAWCSETDAKGSNCTVQHIPFAKKNRFNTWTRMAEGVIHIAATLSRLAPVIEDGFAKGMPVYIGYEYFVRNQEGTGLIKKLQVARGKNTHAIVKKGAYYLLDTHTTFFNLDLLLDAIQERYGDNPLLKIVPIPMETAQKVFCARSIQFFKYVPEYYYTKTGKDLLTSVRSIVDKYGKKYVIEGRKKIYIEDHEVAQFESGKVRTEKPMPFPPPHALYKWMEHLMGGRKFYYKRSSGRVHPRYTYLLNQLFCELILLNRIAAGRISTATDQEGATVLLRAYAPGYVARKKEVESQIATIEQLRMRYPDHVYVGMLDAMYNSFQPEATPSQAPSFLNNYTDAYDPTDDRELPPTVIDTNHFDMEDPDDD